jgi:transketolase
MKLNSATLKKIKLRLLKMHFDAGVGHIGGNLSIIDALSLLFIEYIGTNSTLVLSKGHAAGALYLALWASGHLKESDLLSFHKNGTRLPGHPSAKGLPFSPFATGSLGHGLSLAAGTALAKKFRNSNGRVYCIMSDGEWQEGSTWEALIFACHHKLSNLTILIDNNGLQGFGHTSEVASMESLALKLTSFDLNLIHVDGHCLSSVRNALDSVNETKPSLIMLKTIKGNGVSFMENQMSWHYLPLSKVDYSKAINEVLAE